MKLTKILSLLLAVLLVAALFVGCAEKQKTTEEKTDTETPAQDQQTEPEGVYVVVNGANVMLDVPYAELHDALGEEIQPAEVIESCDENSDWRQTMHFYDGVIITEDKDGLIDGVQVSEGDAALMGKIGIGATPDEVKDLLGEPDTDAEWGIYYNGEGPWVNFYLDEETGNISGFAMMRGMN